MYSRVNSFHVFILCLSFFMAGVFLVPFLATPAKAEGESAFRRVLQEHNKKHLELSESVIRQATTSMIDSYIGDDPDRQKGPWVLQLGSIRIRIELKRTETIDVSAFPVPVLTLYINDREVIVSRGSESRPDYAIFTAQIVDMDPDNPYPEIVFSSFTGGAHCCSDTRILVSSRDGKSWREIEAGLYNGGPLLVNDLNDDGRFELATRDNRFLYAFGCYVCSAAPLKVLQIRNGKIADVSTHEDFRYSQQVELANMVANAPDEEDGVNGFLAGYVAQKILLGEGRQAWDFMVKHYDRKSDWGLDHCSVPENREGKCPPGKKVTLSFPEALKRFLKVSGYALPEKAR